MRIPAVLGLVILVTAAFADTEQQWVPGTDAETSRPTLSQASATRIGDETATKDVTPVFSFRCDPPIIARIDWHRFISSFSTEVGFKVDDGKFLWLKWKVDNSEKVTFSPSSEDTQKLIDLLAAGSKLTVEVTPYSEGPVTAEFDLAGFDSMLDALQANCR